jgi:hypothetical protein
VTLGVAGAAAFVAGFVVFAPLVFFFAAAGFVTLFFEARFFMVANSTAGFREGSTGRARFLTPLRAAT